MPPTRSGCDEHHLKLERAAYKMRKAYIILVLFLPFATGGHFDLRTRVMVRFFSGRESRTVPSWCTNTGERAASHPCEEVGALIHIAHHAMIVCTPAARPRACRHQRTRVLPSPLEPDSSPHPQVTRVWLNLLALSSVASTAAGAPEAQPAAPRGTVQTRKAEPARTAAAEQGYVKETKD